MKNAVTFTLKNAMHPLTEVFHSPQALTLQEAKAEIEKLITQFNVRIGGKTAVVDHICSIVTS